MRVETFANIQEITVRDTIEDFFHSKLICSKGIDAVRAGSGQFQLIDALGRSSAPIAAASQTALAAQVRTAGNIELLALPSGRFVVDVGGNSDVFTWREQVERAYVVELPHAYLGWLCGIGNRALFEQMRTVLPVAYLDSGWGDGSKNEFVRIHEVFLKAAEQPDAFHTRDAVLGMVRLEQLKRLCDDTYALLDRSATATMELLQLQREAVRAASGALNAMDVHEVTHSSTTSRKAATSVTSAVLALCTSLDLSVRLVATVNGLHPTSSRSVLSGQQMFGDLSKLKPVCLREEELVSLTRIWNSRTNLKALIQFRNDIVHNTTALELERKLYVGQGTPEVAGLSLAYAFQPWRDTHENGQPKRFLGRSYFVSSSSPIEVVLTRWVVDVITGHLEISAVLNDCLARLRSESIHRMAGT